MILIAENSSGKGIYDEEKKLLRNSFQGPVIIENGMHIFESELEFVETHSVYGLFIDTRKLSGSFSQVNPYLEDIYYPEMMKHGLHYVSIIVPYDIFSQFSLEDMIQRMGKLELRTFFRFDDGIKWLEEQVAEVVGKL